MADTHQQSGSPPATAQENDAPSEPANTTDQVEFPHHPALRELSQILRSMNKSPLTLVAALIADLEKLKENRATIAELLARLDEPAASAVATAQRETPSEHQQPAAAPTTQPHDGTAMPPSLRQLCSALDQEMAVFDQKVAALLHPDTESQGVIEGVNAGLRDYGRIKAEGEAQRERSAVLEAQIEIGDEKIGRVKGERERSVSGAGSSGSQTG